MEQPPITISAWNHVGIRVAERARAVAFYRHLGFEEVAYHRGPKVSILRNPAGLELNLIVNAIAAPANILMDVPEKHPGYTHASLRVASIEDTVAALGRLGIAITEGPIELGGVAIAVFIRDPDHNVIELAQLLD
ncbi:MAG TPA: VOC family protein [Kofleriaceae bacterium]|nr:VOC family protein [Kofleriaceae bacterium]